MALCMLSQTYPLFCFDVPDVVGPLRLFEDKELAAADILRYTKLGVFFLHGKPVKDQIGNPQSFLSTQQVVNRNLKQNIHDLCLNRHAVKVRLVDIVTCESCYDHLST